MSFSSHFFNTFFVRGFSHPAKPDPPDVSLIRRPLVEWFILATRAPHYLQEPERSYVLQFLRRTETALEEYEEARKLIRSSRVSEYFFALSHYETALSHCYQAIMSGNRLAKRNVFETGDGSLPERLHKLYNASKHAEAKIADGLIPEHGSLAIWLTPDGIECVEAFLSFEELARCILELSDLGSRILDTVASQAQKAADELEGNSG